MADRRQQTATIGAAFIVIGLVLMFDRYVDFNWEWGLFLLGVAVAGLGLKPNGDRGFLFPGTILTVTGTAMLLRKLGWINFEMWKLWPVFFAAIGAGLLTLYPAGYSRRWVFIPGGFFLFIGSAGIGNKSWYRYQHWLRDVVDLWPFLIVGAGIILILGWKHGTRIVEEEVN